MKANYEEKLEEQKVNGNLNMSLYELNKSAVGSLPDCSDEQIAEGKALIEDFVKNDKFFMLLGRDINYYTLFMREPEDDALALISDEVIECLQNIGSIKSIGMSEDNMAVEIWIKSEEDTAVLYFFCYNEGVIVCR